MTRLAAHINDAGITLLGSDGMLYREPGFAFLDRDRLATGNEALANARIHPRSIQHRFWKQLHTEPIADRRFSHLSPADLASHQLEQMWRAAGGASELVLAVPGYMSAGELGLLLGIAGELKLPVVAMVDAAVAATRREYRNAVPVHIDLGLHAATLGRLSQHGQAQLERMEVVDDCGIYALYDAWLNAVAEEFVQQSRFDPLYDAETEQLLLNNLPGWLAEAAARETVSLQLAYRGAEHKAEIESLALLRAAAPPLGPGCRRGRTGRRRNRQRRRADAPVVRGHGLADRQWRSRHRVAGNRR
ncbi:MAG TPA: hypothetical protein VHG33_06400 [Woeseiaceae bacterium]|nr:hypothetical protein [Woeseiaceae bacterium]